MEQRNENQKVGDPNDPRISQHPGSQNQTGKVPVGDREYADIDARFAPRTLSSAQREVVTPIMFAAKDLATSVIEQLPGNRERALALTKLEEFTSWCEKSLIHGNF